MKKLNVYVFNSKIILIRPIYYLESLLRDISHYMILKIAPFPDEYHIYFIRTKKGKRAPLIEAQYVQRIKDLHLVINPILNSTNRWKGIES